MMGNDYKAENSGNNQGLIVGQNTGNINFSLQKVVKIPSLISTVVRTLGEVCSTEDIPLSSSNPQEFKPNEKIEYNCVVKYRDIIREFSAYYSVCENHLNAYDDSNIRGKAKILRCVHLWYLNAKGEILVENKESGKSEIEIIRENSDKLIDIVQNKIYEAVKNSGEIETMYIEDLELGIACFTCFCFMECKILEKPL